MLKPKTYSREILEWGYVAAVWVGFLFVAVTTATASSRSTGPLPVSHGESRLSCQMTAGPSGGKPACEPGDRGLAKEWQALVADIFRPVTSAPGPTYPYLERNPQRRAE